MITNIPWADYGWPTAWISVAAFVATRNTPFLWESLGSVCVCVCVCIGVNNVLKNRTDCIPHQIWNVLELVLEWYLRDNLSECLCLNYIFVNTSLVWYNFWRCFAIEVIFNNTKRIIHFASCSHFLNQITSKYIYFFLNKFYSEKFG